MGETTAWYTKGTPDKEGRYFSREVDLSNVNTKILSTEDGSLDFAEAYVYSQSDRDNRDSSTTMYDSVTQNVLWALRGQSQADLTKGNSEAQKLYDEAIRFKNYREADGEDFDKKAELVDSTDGKYQYVYDTRINSFIAGPITISYNNNYYKDGITSFDSSCSEEDIYREIEGFKLYGNAYYEDGSVEEEEIINFYFSDENGNKLTGSSVAQNSNGDEFPVDRQTFYITIPNQPENYTKIKEITRFSVDFKYLDIEGEAIEISEGSGFVLQYYKWEPKVETNRVRDPYGDLYGYPIYYSYNLNTDEYTITNTYTDEYGNWVFDAEHYRNEERVTNELERKEDEARQIQDMLVMKFAKLFWVKYSLEITFDTPADTPSSGTPFVTPSLTPTPSTPDTGSTPSTPPSDKNEPMYIDIAGIVWVDKADINMETKEIESDNQYFGDNDAEEYPRKNVFVKLYIKDGNNELEVEQGKSYSLKNGDSITIDGSKNKHLVDKNGNKTTKFETYTDASGKYIFYDLPMGLDYFVKFSYDGMKYEPVEYLAGQDEQSYINNPNDIEEEVSKVKEEIGREEFNQKFETITGKSDDLRENVKVDQETTYGRYFHNSDGGQLTYLTKLFGKDDKFNESRLLTTLSESNRGLPDYDDVENEQKHDGIADSKFELTAQTALTYPFYKDGREEIYKADEGKQLEYLKHLNLGLRRRVHADLSLSVKTNAGAITIKDQEKVIQYFNYIYDVDATKEQEEYIKQEISAAGYNWRDQFTQIYQNDGEHTISDGKLLDDSGNVIFDSVKDQMNVYVLYSIKLVNESSLSTDIGRINKIVDYYDKNLEMVTDSNEIQRAYRLFKENATENNKSVTAQWPSEASNSWMAGKDAKGDIKSTVKWNSVSTSDELLNNYNKLEATFDGSTNKNIYLSAETDVEEIPTIYLILKVKNNGNFLNTTGAASDKGMANIAEIASYSILDKDNNILGKVDEDSAPLNAIPGDVKTYEDDAGCGALFSLKVNFTPREIKGTVWEDTNTDGALNDTNKIKGVKVDLIEWLPDGTSIIRPGWKINGNEAKVARDDIVRTDSNGQYSFWIEGGNYQVQFTYGDDHMLANNVKYNAQDYRVTKPYKALSEIYSGKAFVSFDQISKDAVTLNGTGESDDDEFTIDWNAIFKNIDATYDYTQADADAVGFDISDDKASSAREIAEIRAAIIEKALTLTNENAELLNKLKANIDDSTIREKLLPYTQMQSISDIIVMTADDLSNKPTIVNMGLQEREKASVKLKKEVERIVVKTSDGMTIIDTDDLSKVGGVQQLGQEAWHKIDETFINMDASIMDGATVDFNYNIEVTNDAEKADKLENYIYVDSDNSKFSGLISKLNSLFGTTISVSDELPIRINRVYDYVNINLEYRAADNLTDTSNAESSRWTIVYDNGESAEGENFDKMVGYNIDEFLPRQKGKVSKVLKTANGYAENTTKNLYISTPTKDQNGVDKYDTKSVANIPIHLGITLAENTRGDELLDTIYSNCAEIVEIYSGAGRRDYDTVPGNYKPYSDVDDTTEADADLTGNTAITPPLGSGEHAHYYYLVIIGALVIVTGGVVLIKKKVLK